jgi:hypothetical protein
MAECRWRLWVIILLNEQPSHPHVKALREIEEDKTARLSLHTQTSSAIIDTYSMKLVSVGHGAYRRVDEDGYWLSDYVYE